MKARYPTARRRLRSVSPSSPRRAPAEIQGSFEGDLSVSGLLRIENGGSVSGKVLYGRIEVVAGGELSGEINKSGAEDAPAKPANSIEIAVEAD